MVSKAQFQQFILLLSVTIFLCVPSISNATHCGGDVYKGHGPDGSSFACPDNSGIIQQSNNSGLIQNKENSGIIQKKDNSNLIINKDSPHNPNNPKVDASGITVENPLGTKSIIDIFRAILDIIMVFAVPIIVFFIVWAGFLYVTAAGNPEKISQAHKALLYAVIGGVIVLGANILLAVITNTITAFT